MSNTKSNEKANPKLNDSKVDSNLTAIIGISIKGFSEKYIEKKTVTFYKIEITSHITQKNWTLEKRYSEFKTLHDNLVKVYPNLPTIPPTTLFRISNEAELMKRKDALEKFLRECVQRRDVFLNSLYCDFLELNKNAPEVIANDVKIVYDYKKLPLGVRGFIVIPHKEIMCVCCSDMNIISRADSMITNFSFPWEKKTGQHVPLGAAFIYQCKPDKKEIYKIHKIWAKSFPIQTGVIYWEDQNEIYCVGNDDGKIHCFKSKPNTHFLVMIQIAELSFHTDRVMGLALDPKTMNLFSCSTDKTFYVTDLTNGANANTLVNISTVGYTNLEYDGNNQRLFLTNENGELAVYSVVTFPPTLVRNLQTSALSCVRAFHMDLLNKLLFTGSVNGRISIMNLGQPGKERLISEISSFGVGDMKIRICRTNPNTNELFTGDEEGRVTVWSLKTGKPIYLWEAHPKTAITQMWVQTEFGLLWTGGKDMHIRIWKLPDHWVKAEVSEYEETNVEKITAKIAEEKIEKYMKKKPEEMDSDDDDLNGWNYRPY